MTNPVMMNSERFSALAEAFGGDLNGWPADEQSLAQTFVLAHPEIARPILDDAARLDALLDLGTVEPPDQALYETIVASGVRRLNAPPRWAGMAAAVALVFGAGVGWVGTEMNAQHLSTDELVYASAFSVLSETEDYFEDAL